MTNLAEAKVQHDKLSVRLDFKEQEFESMQRTIQYLKEAAEQQENSMAQQSSGQATVVSQIK